MRISKMEPYSTLEVRQVENYDSHDRNESSKEAISQDAGLYQDHGPFRNDRNDKYHVPGQAVESRDTENRQESPPPALKDRVYRFGRLRKNRTCIIIFAVIVFVVIGGAIAGGVVGSLLKRDRDLQQQTPGSPQDDSSGDDTRPGNVLRTSRLAASNWTDAEGVAHRTVFFQDPNSAIIARRWDSEGRKWSTSNVTDIVVAGSINNDNSSSLSPPIPGTPLASAARYYDGISGLQVWYLTTTTNGADDTSLITAASLPKPDEEPDGWWGDESRIGQYTAPGSQLAAAWQRSSGTSSAGNWLLSYQAPEGHINVANSSNWNFMTRVIGSGVSANSSLSMIPQFSSKTGAVDRMALVSESTNSAGRGAMEKNMFTEGKWHADLPVSEDLPPPSPTLQFATTLLHNFTHTMFLALMPDDGTVTAVYWDGDWHDIPRIEFQGGPSLGSGSESEPSAVRFSAIAAGEDAVLYGIADDQVLAYESAANIDPEVGFPVFKYIGRVYP